MIASAGSTDSHLAQTNSAGLSPFDISHTPAPALTVIFLLFRDRCHNNLQTRLTNNRTIIYVLLAFLRDFFVNLTAISLTKVAARSIRLISDWSKSRIQKQQQHSHKHTHTIAHFTQVNLTTSAPSFCSGLRVDASAENNNTLSHTRQRDALTHPKEIKNLSEQPPAAR